MKHIYFTKPLADAIALDYQHLIGGTFSVPYGETIVDFQIDYIDVVMINQDEYDICISSYANNIPFREIYLILNLPKMRLMDYLKANHLKFHPHKYGMGYAKITSEKDENGIDLYL